MLLSPTPAAWLLKDLDPAWLAAALALWGGMLGAEAVPIEDVIASVSNGLPGKNNSSAEDRVRKLERRLTGGRPPVSPHSPDAGAGAHAAALREANSDSCPPAGPSALR